MRNEALFFLEIINKLNINVRSMSGQDRSIREITNKIINTIKKKL